MGKKNRANCAASKKVARMTRLELATPSVTGWCSNQLSYTPTEKDEENSQTAFYFKRKFIKTLLPFLFRTLLR